MGPHYCYRDVLKGPEDGTQQRLAAEELNEPVRNPGRSRRLNTN